MTHSAKSSKDNVAKVKVRAKDATSAKNKAATHMSQQSKKVTKVEHKGIITEKKFERIEPTFDAPKPKAPKQSLASKIVSKLRIKKDGPAARVEPSFDAPKPKAAAPVGKIEPTMNGKPHPTTRIVRGDKGRYKKEAIPPAPEVHDGNSKEHKFVINKDNSIHYHAPDGSKQELFGPMHHQSSAHQLALDSVKFVHKQDPSAKIHVHDSSGGYGKFVGRVSKTSADWSEYHHKKEADRKSRLNDKSPKVRAKAEAEPVPTHSSDPTIPKHKITEENMSVTEETKYAPKKLKDVTSRPSRKWNEYGGNTKDEQDIVDKVRDNTVQVPDRNGNGDDVFKAAKLKRAEKPVNPGDDEKKYAEWNGEVKNIEEAFGVLSFNDLMEAARPLTTTKFGSEKITPRHLDYHWATKHVALHGDRIHAEGDDAVITHHHPDGGRDTTRIEKGAKHISEMPKGTYDHKEGGRSDAHAGKKVVMRTTHSYGKEPKVDFVGAKKRKGSFGGHHHVDDESQAKEFKSAAHAHNHANMMNRYHADYGDEGHPKHFSVHDKRDANQVKASKKAVAVATQNHRETLAKHGHNIYHPEVEKSQRAVQAAKAGPRWS